MGRHREGIKAIGLAAALAMLVAPTVAGATDCSTLPTPIYGIGGSSQQPLIADIAAQLAAATPPQTIIYQDPAACTGINTLLGGTAMTGTASYWTSAGTLESCTLPITGVPADFASMGNTAPGCPGVTALPAGYGDFTGPVTTYNLVVPVASSQQSISAAALYFVYGFGASGMVAPWTVTADIFCRNTASSAQYFVALASGVPSASILGTNAGSNSGMITDLSGSANPEATIGFISGEIADANRATVRTLAYQHTGQTCGYWPDSTVTSFDKHNVRDGQYFLWAPIHFFTAVDGTGHPTGNAANLMGYITGTVTPPAPLQMLPVEIHAGSVPQCAMHVWRTGDLSPLMSYAPPQPCGCYFDSVATGSTTCTACTTSSTCPTSSPVCRNGFCEVS